MRIFYVRLINFNDNDNIDTVNATSVLTFGGGISGHGYHKCWHAYYIMAV